MSKMLKKDPLFELVVSFCQTPDSDEGKKRNLAQQIVQGLQEVRQADRNAPARNWELVEMATNTNIGDIVDLAFSHLDRPTDDDLNALRRRRPDLTDRVLGLKKAMHQRLQPVSLMEPVAQAV